jgi:hypothetical protein
MTRKAVEVLPDPSRTIEGLRDTGYDFETAVADLVDNSIAADADKIDIRSQMDLRGNITLRIADNGTGMDEAHLMQAMKYGSPEREDPSSLGKFGMGLKTASTAFCRRLSVSSRAGGDDETLRASWDLDHVTEVGKWELLVDEPGPEEVDHLESVAPDSSGTVVTWRKVDRLLKDYHEPGGTWAQKALDKRVEALRDHISMVFQRFLDPYDERTRSLSIVVNGEEVESWDAFATDEAELVAEKDVPVEFEDTDKEAKFKVRAYILPRREDFSSDDAAREAKLGNEYQGIYVYRENRLIHGPDWLGMYQKEPHGSLLRVEFSFDHRLDDAFRIDIKKSQINLNEDLYDWLKTEFLPAPRRAADTMYRKGVKKKTQKKASSGPHNSSNRSISNKEKGVDQADVEIIDEDDGDVQVTNKHGKVRLKIRLSDSKSPDDLFVQPVDSINDGLLWEPTIVDKERQGVSVNTSHPYYQKVYVPNHASGVIMQGLDSLLWALSISEMNAVSEGTKQHFEDVRYEVTRVLRRLVEDLPEPKEEDIG